MNALLGGKPIRVKARLKFYLLFAWLLAIVVLAVSTAKP